MSKTSSQSYETSALRIQGCIGKFLSNRLLEQSTKRHKHNCVQSPTQRLSLPGLLLSRKKPSSKKHTIIKDPSSQKLSLTLQPTQCAVNQKYARSLSKEKGLASHHVVAWQLKGHFLVCDALKTLSKKPPVNLNHHTIAPMKKSHEEEPPNPYLHSATKERHFQIDRVVRLN